MISGQPERDYRPAVAWGKYLYLVALLMAFFGLVKYGSNRIFFIEGLGVLDARRVRVEGNLTGRISSLNCRVNDRVAAGTPIVILDQPELEHDFMTRELELENEVAVLKREVENKLRETEAARVAYHHGKELLDLEAITMPEYLDIRDRFVRSDGELSLLRTRLAQEKETLRRIKKEYYGGSDGADGGGDPGRHLKETILYAPTNGMITLINKREGEVAQVGEPILEMADLSDIFIRAYFKGSDEKDIIIGEEVSVHFENGEETTGRIDKVYPATLPLPQEYLRQYERSGRYIIAEILPAKGGGLWPAILGTRAEVRLRRSLL